MVAYSGWSYAKGADGTILGGMADTNAIKWLRTQNVAFDVLEYTFTEIGADHAAEAVGRPLEAVCKTLIVKTAGRAFWVAIVPGDQRFDTRKLAAAVEVKEADLAETEEAEKVSGYQVGGHFAVCDASASCRC